jgi:hypothetical protein
MTIINTYVPGIAGTVPEANFMAVLTKDRAGLYAVYTGIVRETEDRGENAVWIAHHGSKLTLKAANVYFPFLTEKEYRR